VLRGWGFSNLEIAAILDTTPNTVAVALSVGKKAQRRKAHAKNQR
jgi:DNA-directed RNA polymerase specialized sigma24 family protein